MFGWQSMAAGNNVINRPAWLVLTLRDNTTDDFRAILSIIEPNN
jgi:hypothetical protein